MHCLKGTASIAGATVMAATCRGDGLGVDVSASAWHRWDRRVSGKYTRTRRPATMWGGTASLFARWSGGRRSASEWVTRHFLALGTKDGRKIKQATNLEVWIRSRARRIERDWAR